jgi:hypothetical protein
MRRVWPPCLTKSVEFPLFHDFSHDFPFWIPSTITGKPPVPTQERANARKDIYINPDANLNASLNADPNADLHPNLTQTLTALIRQILRSIKISSVATSGMEFDGTSATHPTSSLRDAVPESVECQSRFASDATTTLKANDEISGSH